ncbi:MAG: kelch repeat-containing protein, partial [Acidobacteriota bacterium]
MRGADLHPVEAQLRRDFPTVSLDASATFDAVDSTVNGRGIRGLRAQSSRATTLTVTYPRSYDQPLVVESGSQRLVLRAVGARSAAVTQSGGKLVYERAYESTDTVEVARDGRSEEFLLLHDEHAPLVYDYEIVESEGIASIVLDSGVVRFMPKVTEAPAPSLRIDRPWVIDATGQRSESNAHWSLIGGAMPQTIRLTVSVDQLSYPVLVDPSFSTTGSMGIARNFHTATLLPNGKVLIAGGDNGFATNSAELYDPATGIFTATGSMMTARVYHSATLLPNGNVLVAGGYDPTLRTTFASAEVYNPATGTFSPAGNLTGARSFQTATLLKSGKVLLAGGSDDVGTLPSAELYDPAVGVGGTFTATASLATARYTHTATLLPDGKVLIAGGIGSTWLLSAEVFDPAGGMNGSFSSAGNMAAARAYHTATLLPNGKVLIAAGVGIAAAQLTSAELYTPSSNSFGGTGPLSTARERHTATLLPNGKVLIAGGMGVSYSTSAELYDPAGAGTFSDTGSILTRSEHTATLLPSGRILLAGGQNSGGKLTSAQLYDQADGTFSATANLGTAHSD